MHAVVAKVTISDRASAEKGLRDQLYPRCRRLRGSVTGYWTWKDNTGGR